MKDISYYPTRYLKEASNSLFLSITSSDDHKTEIYKVMNHIGFLSTDISVQHRNMLLKILVLHERFLDILMKCQGSELLKRIFDILVTVDIIER
jgi:hypothetical protein